MHQCCHRARPAGNCGSLQRGGDVTFQADRVMQQQAPGATHLNDIAQ